ncbi:MAG: hypothetical protein KIS61_35350 [Candidatus Eremiobacteraeota bacterium]|nr:hypothetical protein [Candidatus Eremiobacteraeota bacterium]
MKNGELKIEVRLPTASQSLQDEIESRQNVLRALPDWLEWGSGVPGDPGKSSAWSALVASRATPAKGDESYRFYLSNPLLLAGLDLLGNDSDSSKPICKSAKYTEQRRELRIDYEMSIPTSTSPQPMRLNVVNARDWGFHHYDFSTSDSTGFDFSSFPDHLTCSQRYASGKSGVELTDDGGRIWPVRLTKLPARLNVQFWIDQAKASQPGSSSLDRSVEVVLCVEAQK